MAKISLDRITASRGSKDLFNSNFTEIETALENTLSRDGTSPNGMTSDLDMNNQSIINADTITAANLDIDGIDFSEQVANVEASATAAALSETNAATSETNAAASEAQTAADVITVQDQKIVWQGAWASQGYDINDAVLEAGTSYICTATHGTAQQPPNVLYWDVLAQQGSAGAGSGDMLAANNLSDVANAATSRANLVISATNTPNTPAGNIVATDVQAAINELDGEKISPDLTDNLTVGYTTDVEVLGSDTITPDMTTEAIKTRAVAGNITLNFPTGGNGVCFIVLTIDGTDRTISLGANVNTVGTALTTLTASTKYNITVVRDGASHSFIQIQEISG